MIGELPHELLMKKVNKTNKTNYDKHALVTCMHSLAKPLMSLYKNWQSIPSKYFQNYGFAKFNRRI